MSYERRTWPRQSESISTVCRRSHTAEMGCFSGLLLTHYALQVLCCQREEASQLFHALIRDVAGSVGCNSLIQKFLGLFVVGLCDVQGVLQGGLMFQR